MGDNTGDMPPDDPEPANTVPQGQQGGLSRARARTQPDPPLIGNSPTEEHSLNVGVERGLSDPIHPTASRLVATLVPDTIPAAIRTGLRLKASELINGDHVDPDIVAEAIRRWLAKPGAGHGLLASLAADIIRERAAPNGKPGKVRILATLTADARAKEQAALDVSTPKELQ
ncbi:Uncharacterised protein [Mycobacterium tuberculosis]|nr:Uncharacterised protein [Mycobacterium tuberculosis]